jgi:hypothetical protein
MSAFRARPMVPALGLTPDEPDQVLRLVRFREEHPDVIIAPLCLRCALEQVRRMFRHGSERYEVGEPACRPGSVTPLSATSQYSPKRWLTCGFTSHGFSSVPVSFHALAEQRRNWRISGRRSACSCAVCEGHQPDRTRGAWRVPRRVGPLACHSAGHLPAMQFQTA